MGEERLAVAVAETFWRATQGNGSGLCTTMADLNPAGTQMAYGAIGQV